MNRVPVADHGENEQQKGDQQQARSLRGIDRVPVFMAGVVVAFGMNHAYIVRRTESLRAAVLHYASSVVYHYFGDGSFWLYARFSRKSYEHNRPVWSLRTRLGADGG